MHRARENGTRDGLEMHARSTRVGFVRTCYCFDGGHAIDARMGRKMVARWSRDGRDIDARWIWWMGASTVSKLSITKSTLSTTQTFFPLLIPQFPPWLPQFPHTPTHNPHFPRSYGNMNKKHNIELPAEYTSPTLDPKAMHAICVLSHLHRPEGLHSV